MRTRQRPGHSSLFDWLDRTEARVVAQNAALEHERQSNRGRKPRRPWTLDLGRVAEIQKLIRLRHGGPCDTDDGGIYLQAALPHLLRLYAGPELLGRVLGCAQTWLPCVPADQIAEGLDADDAGAAALLTADALATVLGVERQERADLGLRTIGATDFTRRQRLARRRRNDAAYQAAKRKAAGATPRAESNVAKAKALGVSLSTYKRRLAKGLEPAPIRTGEPISSAIVRSTYNPLRYRVRFQNQPFRVQRGRPAQHLASALAGIRPEARRGRSRPGELSRCRYRRTEFPSIPICSAVGSGDRSGLPSLITMAVSCLPNSFGRYGMRNGRGRSHKTLSPVRSGSAARNSPMRFKVGSG